MALDDVVNESIRAIGSHDYRLKSTIERIKTEEGPSNDGKYEDETIALVGNYTRDDLPDEYDGNFNEEVGEYVALVQDMPEKDRNEHLTENLPKAHKAAKKRLIKRVEPNYTAILNELDGANLFDLFQMSPIAESTHDKYEETRKAKKEFDKWAKAVKEEDISVYANSKKHPLIKELLQKNSHSDLVKELMKKKLERAEITYLSPYADLKKLQKAMKNKDEEAIGKAIRSDEVKKYLLANTQSLKPEEKEDMYELTGIIYTSYLEKKADKKKNKRLKEILEGAEK